MTSIVQPSKFSASNVTITPPKVSTNGSGSKSAFLNYGPSSSKLTLQTPSLYSPFGLNVFDKNGPPKYSLDLAMRGWNGENAKVTNFYNALSALDEFMVDEATKNSKLWFKQELKREVVEAFYTPSVKFGRDKEGNPTPYPPNVKVQLRKKRAASDAPGGDSDLSNSFDVDVFDASAATDANARPIKGVPMGDLLVRRVEVTCLIECTGVWFAGGKFGLSWKASQMRVDKAPSGLVGRGYAFVQDEDDAGEAEPDVPASSSFKQAAEGDEEEDEEDEEEVAVAPPPKKTSMSTKKVVAKAKAK
jgi:hypothetical protein